MKVTEMFPAKYAKGEHLHKPRLVEIHAVEPTELRAGPGKPAERAYLLWFDDVSTGAPVRIAGVAYVDRSSSKRCGHALVLRGVLAKQIAQIVGTEETDEWEGKRAVLFPENAVVAGRSLTLTRARAPKLVPVVPQSPAVPPQADPNSVIEPQANIDSPPGDSDLKEVTHA